MHQIKNATKYSASKFVAILPNAKMTRLYAYLCGDILEMTAIAEPKAEGVTCPKTPTNKESRESIAERSIRRARRNIRMLVNTNKLHRMVTLTMAVEHIKYRPGEKHFDLVTLTEQANRESVVDLWAKYTRKLRDKGIRHDYLAVIELHTGKRAEADTVKKGTYHIHYATNAKISEEDAKQVLQPIWNHGFVDIADWEERDIDNPGDYMSKYIGKDFEEAKKSGNITQDMLIGKKRFWTSQGLLKPLRLSPNEAYNALLWADKIIYNHIDDITDEEGNLRQTARACYHLESTRPDFADKPRNNVRAWERARKAERDIRKMIVRYNKEPVWITPHTTTAAGFINDNLEYWMCKEDRKHENIVSL